MRLKYSASLSGYCLACGGIFEKGERIFQLAKGTYYFPFITPTLWTGESVAGEWHLNCLGMLFERLHPQTQPYHCCFYGDEIEDKTLLVYGVIGKRPETGYIRPEHRGYELQVVSHYGCWFSRKEGWFPSQNPLSRLWAAVRAERIPPET
jgi:hypothetical protein